MNSSVVIVADMDKYNNFVTSEFALLIKGVSQAYGWPVFEMDKITEAIATDAKILLIFENFYYVLSHGDQVRKSGKVLGMYVDDSHYFEPNLGLVKSKAFTSVDFIICAFPERLKDFYPEVRPEIVKSLPHAALPMFLMPMNTNPEPTVVLSGMIWNALYQYRLNAIQLKIDHPEIAMEVLGHPGYRTPSKQEDAAFYDKFDEVQAKTMKQFGVQDLLNTKKYVGLDYARKLNSHIAGVTCGLVIRYVVAKHFEIAAAGSLVITDKSMEADLALFGWKDRVNYLAVDIKDLKDAIEWVVDPKNRGKVDGIRRRGQQLVMERHMLPHRIKQFGEIIQEIHVCDFQ